MSFFALANLLKRTKLDKERSTEQSSTKQRSTKNDWQRAIPVASMSTQQSAEKVTSLIGRGLARMMPLGLAGAVALSGFLGPPPLAVFTQADEVAKKAEVAQPLGKWKIRIDGGGEIYTAYFTLQSRDGRLEGLYENEGRRSRVTSAKLKGNVLTVVVNTQRFSTPVVATFTCDLQGDKMSGEVDLDLGSTSRSYPFSGIRIAQLASSDSPGSGPSPAPQANGEPVTPAGEKGAAVEVSSGPQAQTVSFRAGVNGYQGTLDVEIWEIAPTKSLVRQGTMTVDGNNGGGESQVLLRFDEVFGEGPNRIPKNVRVVSATLTVVAFDPGTTCHVHRLLIPWTPAATWDGMANGISVDNQEASTVRDGFTFGEINMDKQSVRFNVTATVQKWVDGEPNHGWVFVNTGSNGWDFYSSDWKEVDLHPMLEVTFEGRAAAPKTR